jgi:MarR family transcriptional regulator, organic hydroperoxide resistance regulator
MKDELLKLDNQLCFALYSTSLAMEQLYRKLLADLNLTYPQYLVMLCLWEKKELPVMELANLLHLDSGTMSPLLKRMEKEGLITRVRSKEDERKVLVTLTTSGKKLKDKAYKVPEQVLDCSCLCKTELIKLKNNLNDLRDKISQ